MSPERLRREEMELTNASYYRGVCPDNAARFRTTKWTDEYLPIMKGDGHWVVACDGTVDTTYGGELLDTRDRAGLTQTSAFFASVFAQDEESRGALKEYLDVETIQILLEEMSSEDGVVADRMRMGQQRWEDLHRAAGSQGDGQKQFYTVQANALRSDMKEWINQAEDSPSQGGWLCEYCMTVGNWDENLRHIRRKARSSFTLSKPTRSDRT